MGIFDQDFSNRSVMSPVLAPTDKKGRYFVWKRFHTAVVGTSGAGKNSPLLAMIWHDAPLIREGKVAPYALISPKDAQLTRLGSTWLVDEFATKDIFEQLEVVGSVWRTMNKRIEYEMWKASLTAQEREAAIAAGKYFDLPPKILMIDEYSSFFKKSKDYIVPGVELAVPDKKTGEKVVGPAKLSDVMNDILSQGRSARVFVVIATQHFNIEFIGDRNNFGVWIFLRIQPSNSDWINKAADEGAKEAGFRPDLIPVDGTAGIGFVRDNDNGGEVLRVRFPYTPPEKLDELIEATKIDMPYTGPTEFPDLK